MIVGKNYTKIGICPSIICINPKHARNLGMIVRLASCFDFKQVWYTGNRIKLTDGERLPREERMKGYAAVDLIQNDYPFEMFDNNVTPVAIEIRQNSENLLEFEHPANAVYIFGPEDGGLQRNILQHCHRFVQIPTKHCLNLATAVSTVMYDRMLKSGQGLELAENRGKEKFNFCE